MTAKEKEVAKNLLAQTRGHKWYLNVKVRDAKGIEEQNSFYVEFVLVGQVPRMCSLSRYLECVLLLSTQNVFS